MKIRINNKVMTTTFSFGYSDDDVSMHLRDPDYYDEHACITMSPDDAREMARTLNVFADICEKGIESIM